MSCSTLCCICINTQMSYIVNSTLLAAITPKHHLHFHHNYHKGYLEVFALDLFA